MKMIVVVVDRLIVIIVVIVLLFVHRPDERNFHDEKRERADPKPVEKIPIHF